MASTADFRSGMVIKYNNDLWTIVEFQHVNPGNWRAFVRVKMKNIKSGKVLENRFRAGESIESIRVERKTFQYLYRDGADYAVMDNETYEQMTISSDLMAGGEKYLKENINIDLLFNGSEIIAIELPIFAILRVTMTEPGLKGDTVSNTLKPATLETGATVMVPLFVNENDLLKIDTRTGYYVERVKE